MDHDRVEQLLTDLKQPDISTRDRASATLWHSWFHQKGVYGAQQLMQAETLLKAGHVTRAEALLQDIIQAQPDFAEAWNRRAVLHYTQSNYWPAIADCQQAIQLIPHHFGALHGLGLCHCALGNYVAAIQAFRQALAVQPYALTNQRMILECTAQLDEMD
ncbi:MAG: tetratricopeptide repeat protein [Cyanobacteria bacterium J06634_5]